MNRRSFFGAVAALAAGARLVHELEPVEPAPVEPTWVTGHELFSSQTIRAADQDAIARVWEKYARDLRLELDEEVLAWDQMAWIDEGGYEAVG